MIAGEKEPPERNEKMPERKEAKPGKCKFDLVVDIQEKMAQGKNGGYVQWAKKYNVKQFAESILFLQQHDIHDKETLDALVDGSSAKYHELMKAIKDAEEKMAANKVIKTHIINYAKTRETYIAYRKSGYSKNFSRHTGMKSLFIKRPKIIENDLDAQVENVIISDSRCRGIEKNRSDLDVVVDYKGTIREDDFFNILHEDGFTIAGIVVDINPITEDKTGLLAEYLESAEQFLKEKVTERKQEKPSVRKKIKQAKQISQDRKTGNIEKSKNAER